MSAVAQSESASRLNEYFSKSRSVQETLTLTWADLNYSIATKDSAKSTLFKPVYKNKVILRSMNGSARSGELLAIMGPTGCGKSSLLNILASRVSTAQSSAASLTGSIILNGTPRDDSLFRRISAYVLQDDRMYAHMTVHETLLLSAHFYLPNSVTDAEKEVLVTQVIAELGLTKVRDTIIGDEKVRGVSGGERRRANIGMQLIVDPAVLFLDEPTSGLDSFQAQAVMESMKYMARSGRLVVTVIHQPRSSIFDMFDQLLLLSEGRTIYLGPAKEASQYFVQNGYSCPKFFNPADYFLDVLSPDTRSAELELATGTRILQLSEKWISKETSSSPHHIISSSSSSSSSSRSHEGGGGGGGGGGSTISVRRSSDQQQQLDVKKFLRNIKLLFWRSFSQQLRLVFPQAIKLVLAIFFGCVIGGIYQNQEHSYKSIRNRSGFLFVVIINQGFGAVTNSLNSFPAEKLIVNRERANHAYDTLSYYFAKFFAELPFNLLFPFVFCVIAYNIANMNPDRFGQFLAIVFYTIVSGLGFGMFVSACSSSSAMANAIGIPCVVIFLLFAGFYIIVDSIPIVANLIPYISFMRWGFQMLIVNEFKGESFECVSGSEDGCVFTGEEAINQYFRNTSIGHPIMGQGILLIGWTGLAIAALFLNNLSYLTFGHVGSLLKDRSDIIYEAEDNTTAAYRQLKQQDTTTTDTEKPETGGGIIELNHIYSSPSTVSGKQ